MEKWAVVKVETLNGVRIGITQEDDLIGEVLEGNLTENEAEETSQGLSKELNIPLFDNNEDTAL